MKLNLKDKTIDVDRNIEITAEEIAEVLNQTGGVKEVADIFNHLVKNYLLPSVVAIGIANNLDTAARDFFNDISKDTDILKNKISKEIAALKKAFGVEEKEEEEEVYKSTESGTLGNQSTTVGSFLLDLIKMEEEAEEALSNLNLTKD